MHTYEPLLEGTLLKRYKRFLCDIVLKETGQTVTAHCPNSGSMKGIPLAGSTAMLSHHPSPMRKLHYTLEMVHNGSIWIGVNTALPNLLAKHGIRSGIISELDGYPDIKREVKYSANSRIDLLLSHGDDLCYVEVKNVTLTSGEHATFPDAVTTRGQKHLRDLIAMKQLGHRSAMLFIVQRTDCSLFRPAYEIDSAYAELFTTALNHGVEAYAYQVSVTPAQLSFVKQIPIDWPA